MNDLASAAQVTVKVTAVTARNNVGVDNEGRRDWTVGEVRRRIEAAMRAVVRLPDRMRPSTRMTMPLDVVRDANESYGYEAARSPRVLPSSVEIDRMSRALGWLLMLPEARRQLVMARSVGLKWRTLEPRFGLTERRLRTLNIEALAYIATRLNGRRPRPLVK